MAEILEALEEGQLLEQQQRYFAKMCAGTSVVRSQGPKGMKAAGQHFLANMDLNEFSNCEENHYLEVLNHLTVELQNQFPGWGAGNWGVARKILNIFLFHCTMNQPFCNAYEIDHMRPFLEVTLDTLVINFLKLHVGGDNDNQQTLREWTRIKYLEQPLSDRIQDIAQEIANQLGCNRCDIDFLGWRDD